jgi:hypothetical protein
MRLVWRSGLRPGVLLGPPDLEDGLETGLRPGLPRSGAALRNAYLAGVDWEPAADLDARAAPLTAAVLLARVDGKSPADYLQTEDDRGFVRETARRMLAAACRQWPG